MTDYPLSVLNEPCDRDIPVQGRGLDKMLAAAMGTDPRYAPKCDNWKVAGLVIDKMQSRGLYLELRSPFAPERGLLRWHAGFTPHGVTGWNGRQDYHASAPTGPLAVARAAVLWYLEKPE